MSPVQAELSRIHTRNRVLYCRYDLHGPNALHFEEVSGFVQKIDDFTSRFPNHTIDLADMRRFWSDATDSFKVT
jgi:hypothetical protein